MDVIKEVYGNNLVYIFNKDQLLDKSMDYLVIIKDECQIQEMDGCKTMHYQDDFESLLKFTLPTKNRKTKQLISLQQCLDLMDRVPYGVLSFCKDGLPYSVGLNHIMYNDKLYFHCAKKGYKLNSINQRVAYLVIEDLGINLDVGTHNHNSVAIYGRMKEVTNRDEKKEVLLTLIRHLVPAYNFKDAMVDATNILELEVDYINGKTHIR